MRIMRMVQILFSIFLDFSPSMQLVGGLVRDAFLKKSAGSLVSTRTHTHTCCRRWIMVRRDSWCVVASALERPEIVSISVSY